MGSRIVRFLSKISASNKFKNVFFWCVVILTTLYIFSIPSFSESESFTRYIVYLSMSLLGLFVVLFCFLYADFKLRREVILIPAFALIALIGTIVYSKMYRQWFSLVLLTISFLIFIYAFKIMKKKFLILNVFTVGLFLFSLYFIFYFRDSFLHFSFSNRLGPPFDNQNGVAAFAVLGFSMPLYLLLFDHKKIRFIYIIPTLTSFLVGVSTGSRTFFVISLLFLVVLFWFRFKNHKLIYLISLGVLVGLAILFINLPFMVSYKQRIVASFDTFFGKASKVDTSTLQRTVYTDYGFVLGSKNLFFGYGAEGFSIYSGVGTYSHSNYAELLCNFGLFGFILFYLPLLIIFLRIFINQKIDKAFIFSFFIYYIIVSFTNVLYYKKIYYLVLSLLYYLAFFDYEIMKEKPLIKNLNKVVFTCDSMDAGGAEKVIASLSNQMAKKHISVTIIGVSAINNIQSFYSLDKGVQYLTLAHGSKQRINSFKRILLLRKTIKNISPDVVISFLPHVIVYTKFSLAFTKIPLIVSERNNPYLDPKGILLRQLRNISFNLADGCVFQTEEAMNFYSPKFRSKSVIIKNPISLKFIPHNSLFKRNKTILAVGRLTEQKNYKCLLKAFSIFNTKQNGTYKLKIYGEGPLENELREYSESLGICSKVVFAGQDNNWQEKEYLDAMYVLSSDYEGMPNSLAEAMALGIPSISTDCPTGGSRELIVDGNNGFLTKVNDPYDLVDKMAMVTDEKANDFFKETREMINIYSIDEITNKWIHYLSNLRKESYE